MRQIIVVTDGCSNAGVSPVVAAAHALSEGIVVNVIGVTDQSELGQKGMIEIGDIAKAGGGISRIVRSQLLAQTMQMVTRKTVSHTIQQTIDELSETTDLQVALLIDTSLSMKSKLPAVQEAMQDLLLSLQARVGKSELAIFHFPASENLEEAEMDTSWTQELAKLPDLFYKLNMKGMTPTGPALLQVIRFIQDHRASTRQAKNISQSDKDGMLSDYVG
jgi:Ca-activated chloride channel family protein